MAIKYLPIDSTGVSFDVDETRTVEVTNEALTAGSGFEGDLVTYTATVKDNTGAALPDTFYATLIMDGFDLIAGNFGPGIYDPITFVLTAPFLVPDLVGSFIVKLTSEEQII